MNYKQFNLIRERLDRVPEKEASERERHFYGAPPALCGYPHEGSVIFGWDGSVCDQHGLVCGQPSIGYYHNGLNTITGKARPGTYWVKTEVLSAWWQHFCSHQHRYKEVPFKMDELLIDLI